MLCPETVTTNLDICFWKWELLICHFEIPRFHQYIDIALESLVPPRVTLPRGSKHKADREILASAIFAVQRATYTVLNLIVPEQRWGHQWCGSVAKFPGKTTRSEPIDQAYADLHRDSIILPSICLPNWESCLSLLFHLHFQPSHVLITVPEAMTPHSLYISIPRLDSRLPLLLNKEK